MNETTNQSPTIRFLQVEQARIFKPPPARAHDEEQEQLCCVCVCAPKLLCNSASLKLDEDDDFLLCDVTPSPRQEIKNIRELRSVIVDFLQTASSSFFDDKVRAP